jgi:hypothetical protein
MEREPKENNSKVVLAVFLIVIGTLWLLKKVGFYFEFPRVYFENIFYPFKQVFHWLTHFIFSWPMILIIIGIVLMAGRRSAGIVLIVVGGIFLLPKIFFLPGLTISFLLPVVLIGIGVALVARIL